MRVFLLVLLVGLSLSPQALAATGQGSFAPVAKAAPAAGERVDINRASVAELMEVPGMTPVWAERIVRYRPYYSKRALLDQGIVPAKVYERIKEYIIAHRVKSKP